MEFIHQIIDKQTPGTKNDVCLIADVNNDGFNDIVIGGKFGDGNIVWYEYPHWKRHTIGTARLEAGGVMMDVTGNSLLDLVAGQPHDGDGGPDLYWFENPGIIGQEWTKRIICHDLNKYHDQCVGDIDGDGKDELIISSQKARVLAYYDIPADPTVSPWPKSHRHIIWEDIEVEGLVVADIDGDGEMELVAGPNWFKRTDKGWKHHSINESYRLTRVAVADLTGSGLPNIVLTEGESHPARLAWVTDYPECKVNVINQGLFHPHSLAVADFNGNGRPDIFVGEMDLARCPHKPRVLVFENLGNEEFEQHVVTEGIGTHDAKVGTIGNGVLPSIIGKPYHPGNQVDLWRNIMVSVSNKRNKTEKLVMVE